MRTWTYVKISAAFAVCLIGGPMLIKYVQPDPDELFKRYNPDLQKKSLSQREQRQKEHEEHMARLREYSKSDKPIWVIAAEEEKKRAKAAAAERRRAHEELERQKQMILDEQKREASS